MSGGGGRAPLKDEPRVYRPCPKTNKSTLKTTRKDNK